MCGCLFVCVLKQPDLELIWFLSLWIFYQKFHRSFHSYVRHSVYSSELKFN